METDRKDEENKNSGENAEVDREQLISDRDQAKVRKLKNYKGSRSDSLLIAIKSKSETSDFEVDRDQHHLLIAIKVGQNYGFLQISIFKCKFEMGIIYKLYFDVQKP